MKESLSPTNVVEMGTGGIDSLRAKSGLGERQATEMQTLRDGKTKSIIPKDEYAEYSRDFDKEILGKETTPLMSKIENRVGGMRGDIENRVGTLLDDVGMTPQAIDASIASDKTGIMASVAKGDLPAKTGAAREFLVNTIKVGDD